MEMGLSPKIHRTRRAQWSGPPISYEWETEIASKPKHEQIELQQQMAAQASSLYFDKEFDGAAFLWERCLYLTRMHSLGAEKEAALCSNVGAACHSLGEFDEAISRYEAAAELFAATIAASNRLDRWMGDTDRTQRRIDYIRHRISQASREEPPTQGEWLDSDARVQRGTKQDFERSSDGARAASAAAGR